MTWRYDEAQETQDLRRDEVLRIVAKAFALWSSKTNLRFEQTDSENPDIWIRFGSSATGDHFDGRGGALARAFYPVDSWRSSSAGDVYFDDAEYFVSESEMGKDLLQIATHQIGNDDD